ncbi:MAG: hypothetical protein ACRD3W_11760, partial [Terriglobales bacterium]
AEAEPFRRELAKRGKFDGLGHYNSCTDISATFDLGCCYAWQYKSGPAIEQYEKALRLCHNEHDRSGMLNLVTCNLAVEYHYAGRDTEAIRMFKQSLVRDSRVGPEYMIEFAQSYVSLKQYSLAEPILINALRNEELLFARGFCRPSEFYDCTRVLLSVYDAEGKSAEVATVRKKIADYPLTEQGQQKQTRN